MAHIRENHFNPSSPHSSTGGAESFKGTPDTRLTALSPDEGSIRSSAKLLKSFTRAASTVPQVKLPVNSYRGAISQLDKDPFVSPAHGTTLSPTASTFRPVVNVVSLSSAQDNRPIATTLSTELGLSRHLNISSSTPLSIVEVDRCLTELAEGGTQIHDSREFEAVDGYIRVHFSDIRDAYSAYSGIRMARQGWEVRYAGPRDTSKDTSQDIHASISEHGQVLAVVSPSPGTIADPMQTKELARGILQSFGQLFAFIPQISFADGSFRAIAQYCNPSAAMSAIETCKGLFIEGIQLTVQPLQVSSAYDLASALKSVSLSNDQSEPAKQNGSLGRLAPSLSEASNFPMFPVMFPTHIPPTLPYALDRLSQVGHVGHSSHMTPSYSVIGPLYQAPPSPALTTRNDYSPSRSAPVYGRLDSRRQNATRVARSSYHNASSHHNHVDIGRIRDGIDVRTTIMLRNIPNKVDQAMLKRIIDESSWGKYDFMYLRIDFANDCNVGYAFVNFVDPLDIIDFVNARGNQRWNCFKSDKVAEISYATIQGKDCLVQKFRNSSVMLEQPHYRPKLYFTSNGPMPELAGQEEPFPEPDNQSKMKRSCENAEHVGLFTPNAGQHFRDEQRRRRSQYDRGTRLAALEEYDYEAAIRHLYGTPSQ